MAKALAVSTKFTAVDKFSQTMKKMTVSVKSFSNKAVSSFHRVERAGRRLRNTIAKSVGKLGLTIGFLALFNVATSAVNVFADFEQANASLAAVMGRTVQQNSALTKDAKRLGAVTAKTATEVTGLQEAFARLGFEESAIINMTQSTIAGSIAMKSELADTAELVGAMVNSFDSFSSIDAPKIIDQMTLATQKSALNFQKLQVGLPIVAGAANAAGVDFTTLLALLGKLSDAGIDTSSSATALRNIFIDSKSKGHSYGQILENIQKNQEKLTAANDEFGKKAAVSAVILANNINATAALDKILQGAANTAETAANKQLNTLNGRLTLLGSAWEGFILATDDGTGSLSSFLKTSIEVITEMLSLASGTAKAESALDDAGQRIRSIANFTNGLIKTVRNLTIAYYSVKLAIFSYNIAMGIMGAVTGTASIAIGSSTIALNAYKVASGVAAAATWLFNSALLANPITWVVLAVAALIAGIVLLIKNFDSVIAWTKKAGNAITSFLLAPIQAVLFAINKLTGSRFGGDALAKIKGIRADMSVSDERQPALNQDATIEQVRTERIESTKNEKLSIELNAAKGTEATIKEDTTRGVNLTQTLGWQ